MIWTLLLDAHTHPNNINETGEGSCTYKHSKNQGLEGQVAMQGVV